MFVGNRIGEIYKSSESLQWRFVPGKLNPVDLTTRGTSMQEADKRSIWLNGPTFLKLEESEWPTMSEIQPLEADDFEVRTLHVTTDATDAITDETMITYHRFSSWRKLCRDVSWMGVFIKIIRRCSEVPQKTRLVLTSLRQNF